MLRRRSDDASHGNHSPSRLLLHGLHAFIGVAQDDCAGMSGARAAVMYALCNCGEPAKASPQPRATIMSFAPARRVSDAHCQWHLALMVN